MIMTWLSSRIKISASDLHVIIDGMDADGDGMITIAELIKEVKRWMKK